MARVLHTESTLTDRYQTTIPEPIRDALHLKKRDKISYEIDENGKVIISRVSDNDPVLSKFLSFVANDIKNNPSHVRSIDPTLIERALSLISGVEVDMDAPLSEKDE